MQGDGRPDVEYLQQLIQVQSDFSAYGDVQASGQDFYLEVSPFAEKPIGSPIGHFELVLYPKNPRIIAILEKIGDPTFEHADGAFAFAAFCANQNHLLVEEIQTDVVNLLEWNGRKYSVKLLRDLIAQWPEILFESIRSYARHVGYGDFYASTPWRILRRYGGIFHPDKARTYFEGLEKLGGELVYDRDGEFGWPQYYYRFETK